MEHHEVPCHIFAGSIRAVFQCVRRPLAQTPAAAPQRFAAKRPGTLYNFSKMGRSLVVKVDPVKMSIFPEVEEQTLDAFATLSLVRPLCSPGTVLSTCADSRRHTLCRPPCAWMPL